jgi:starch synthase
MKPLHAAASLYTIHNLAYQGVFDPGALPLTGLGSEHYHARELEHFGTMNLTKAALYRATFLSTVSPTYAREIQTPGHGFGLDGVLAERRNDLFGVLNGIDTEEWNPEADPLIAAAFSAASPAGKAECKRALQTECGLPVRSEVPVFGLVGRLTRQKGVDVVAQILSGMLELDLQLVLLGSGDRDVEAYFAHMAARRPDRFAAFFGFDNQKAHRIEAGADLFLMPSRYEPCGLNQLYSLRYGTLPIVRATGGLADTVLPYDERTGQGTGFVFHDLTPGALYDVMGWAVSTWYDRPQHIAKMQREAMHQDFSWDRSAIEYEKLYLAARARRRGPLAPT